MRWALKWVLNQSDNLDISKWLLINGRSGERFLQREAEERAEHPEVSAS